ncbi:MAG: DUF115 domain-containing protein [Treponema sp.]|nr:DUF115 domain-containing protein [Treponema sp.]
MDKQEYYERNLLALARFAPLCSKITGAQTTLGKYKFLDSPSGEIIPAYVDQSGSARPLHSLMDPRREAGRLMQAGGEGFIVLLGLGGGFCAEAALEQKNTAIVLVIDYDADSIAELLCHRDYVKIFMDPRFYLLVDPPKAVIEQFIPEIYKPMLHGGIRILPLRARTAGSLNFSGAREAAENALNKVSADYSVQSYFGMRWFSNIIRNLKKAGGTNSILPPIKRAAVTAAGPSLSYQLKIIADQRSGIYLIATDTSLPCLLSQNIRPDAVVSIDCQHIGYYHFMSGIPPETILFMDLAAPALTASCTDNVRFFTGNHPLAAYASLLWRPLPEVDTSGGNVTYSAIDLAEKLGAVTIELYGADFSYPSGLTYATGTYIHQLFYNKQKRLAPLEAQHSAFLYRGLLVKKTQAVGWYYESPSLKFYRERLEEKSTAMDAELRPIPGLGPLLTVPDSPKARQKYFLQKLMLHKPINVFGSGKCLQSADDFLNSYKNDINKLPAIQNAGCLQSFYGRDKQILTTLLPVMAGIKRRNPDIEITGLAERTKQYCVTEIEKVLDSGLYND